MHSTAQTCKSFLRTISRAATLALAIVFVLALILIFTQPAQAQAFKVLYSFTGGADGANPGGRLVMDADGNLYGTAMTGGTYDGACAVFGCGTVFKLSPQGSEWVFSAIYTFTGVGNGDGEAPVDMIFGPDGTLYGLTQVGGKFGMERLCGKGGSGCGTVFNLKPTDIRPSGWTETVLYRFTGADGYESLGLVADPSGNLYSASSFGGADFCDPYGWFGCGIIYKLSPAGGGWRQTILYSFTRLPVAHAFAPSGAPIFDQAGNLYGTTTSGGITAAGVVYKLTPTGSGWTQQNIFQFNGNTGEYGIRPFGYLTFDQNGNLYGMTSDAGPHGGGTVYELSPSDGGWAPTLLYGFNGGDSPAGGVVMDAAGSLYGAQGDPGHGFIFKLTPGSGGWTYTRVHTFTGTEGQYAGRLLIAPNGKIYGATYTGGSEDCITLTGCGVIFEITP